MNHPKLNSAHELDANNEDDETDDDLEIIYENERVIEEKIRKFNGNAPPPQLVIDTTDGDSDNEERSVDNGILKSKILKKRTQLKDRDKRNWERKVSEERLLRCKNSKKM